MKLHTAGQSHKHSLIECILMRYYLLPPVNHQQADLFSYHNYNDRLWLANQNPNTNYVISQVECLKCRNNRSNHLKLHTFGCKCLSFHTVYGFETLGIHLCSPSLLACKVLGKYEFGYIWLGGV